eukprot:SAG25_NODE_467_length_7729_cov_268.210457_2_plen_424_part_00
MTTTELDSCFLNRFRGLEFEDTAEQGIDPASFLTDSTMGNVFHAAAMLVGLVLCFGGRRYTSFTLFTVGFIVGGLTTFFGASTAMVYIPQLYSCWGLGIVALLGAVVTGLYISRALGAEGIFSLLGTVLGFIGGYFFYKLFFVNLNITSGQFINKPQGIVFMGRDAVELVVILAGGIGGNITIGKVPFVRKNALSLYSSAMGAVLITIAADYLIVARLGPGFLPVTGVGNPGATTNGGGAAGKLKLMNSVLQIAALALTAAGFFTQVTCCGAAEDEDWKKEVDPQTGRVYYYNSAGDTFWEDEGGGAPADFGVLAAGRADRGYGDPYGGDPYGPAAYGPAAYGPAAYAGSADPYGDPYGAGAYGGGPYGGGPYGSGPYGDPYGDPYGAAAPQWGAPAPAPDPGPSQEQLRRAELERIMGHTRA